MTIPRRSAVLALLLAACADDPAPADAPRPVTPAQTMESAAAAIVAAAPAPAAEQDTMLTRWTTLPMPSEPWIQEAATPEALLRQVRNVVAAQMEEPDASVLPTRMESRSAEGAVGLLTHPNLADDSIRDVEFRIHMRPAGAVWRVTGADRRERCRRGVSEENRCV